MSKRRRAVSEPGNVFARSKRYRVGEGSGHDTVEIKQVDREQLGPDMPIQREDKKRPTGRRSQSVDDWLQKTTGEVPIEDPDQRSLWGGRNADAIYEMDRSIAATLITGSRITSRPREVIQSLGERRVQMQPTDEGFLGEDLCKELFRGRHEEPTDVEGLKLDAKLSRFSNEAGIVRANSAFLTPTPLSLRWQETFIASTSNTLWLGVPPMGHKIPKPALTVGLARESLNTEQRAKYDHFIDTYPAAGILDTLFPFLICGAKAGQGLESANRQCTHAAAIAVRSLLFLYASVYGVNSEKLQSLFGQPLVFSIAYDAVRVEIYAHFAVLDSDGKNIEYRRNQRAFFSIEYPDYRDFLVAWHFVLTLYKTFAVTHRDRIYNALNDLQPGQPNTTDLSSMFPHMTGSLLPPAWTNKQRRPEQGNGDSGQSKKINSSFQRLEESEKRRAESEEWRAEAEQDLLDQFEEFDKQRAESERQRVEAEQDFQKRLERFDEQRGEFERIAQALKEQMSLSRPIQNPAGVSLGTPSLPLNEGGRMAAATAMPSPPPTLRQGRSEPVRFKLWHNDESCALSASRTTTFEDFQNMIRQKLNVHSFVMKAGTTTLNDEEDLSMVIEESQGGRIEVCVSSEGTAV